MSTLDASIQQVLSPKWKKPGDVMKKIYSQKRNPQKCLSFSQSTNRSNDSAKLNLKRGKNPFAKKRSNNGTSEHEKKRILSENSDDAHDSWKVTERLSASSILDAYNDECNENNNSSLDFVYLNEDSFMGLVNVKGDSTDANVSFRKCLLPFDWTLKSKARFLSSSTFSWCARIKGSEEATAISRATRCLLSDQTSPNFRVELGKSLIYWQHPHIPWFSLFPRYGADCGFTALSAEPNFSESVQSRLYDSWVVAFRSVYQLLKNDLCPFFYVCSQQYTALFRASKITLSEVDCVLTPTSLGFRKALMSEEILFSSPFQKQKEKTLKSNNEHADSLLNDSKPHDRQSSFSDQEDKENQDLSSCDAIGSAGDSSQEDVDSDDEQNWKNISKNLSFKKSRTVVAAATEDGLPNTAILIQGSDNTQLLFNHLLNSRNSIATSGRQAGMPPTILSPVSFNSATLRKLDCRAGIAKIRNNSQKASTITSSQSKHQHYSLDVSGPIMPHHLNSLVSLLDSTQENGDYSCSFGSFMYTGPFNAPCGTLQPCETKESSGDDFLKHFVNKFDAETKPTTMRKMNALNETYEWEV